MPNFDKLVEDLRNVEVVLQFGKLKGQVRPVLKRIETALQTIPLDESRRQQLFAIVNKAFEEANLPLIRKENSDPKTGQNDNLSFMGACIAGIYPTNAYNVEVFADESGLVAFIWPVPKEGNPR